MDLKLLGRTALVTGSSSGIGAGVARMLAAEGCRVVVHGRDHGRAQKVADEIGAAGIALGDLSTNEGADSTASQALAAAGGRIDILVNNAGGGGDTSSKDWLDVNEAEWVATYEANTVAAMRMIRRLVPAMKEGGWGRLLQITSAVAVQPSALGPDYASAKAGMQNMTVGLAKALTNTGITANTISPGVILTQPVVAFANKIAESQGWGTKELSEQEVAVRMGRDRHKLPVGRIGAVEDIGYVVCMLASPLSGYITGANVRADGGQVSSVN